METRHRQGRPVWVMIDVHLLLHASWSWHLPRNGCRRRRCGSLDSSRVQSTGRYRYRRRGRRRRGLWENDTLCCQGSIDCCCRRLCSIAEMRHRFSTYVGSRRAPGPPGLARPPTYGGRPPHPSHLGSVHGDEASSTLRLATWTGRHTSKADQRRRGAFTIRALSTQTLALLLVALALPSVVDSSMMKAVHDPHFDVPEPANRALQCHAPHTPKNAEPHTTCSE
jgi:hypothetical protein